MSDIDEDVYTITIQTIQEKLAQIEIEMAKVKKNLSNLTSTVDDVVLTCCKLGGLWMNSELELRQKSKIYCFRVEHYGIKKLVIIEPLMRTEHCL